MAVDLNFERDDSERCAAIAASLLDGPALQWHHRLAMANEVPEDFGDFVNEIIR